MQNYKLGLDVGIGFDATVPEAAAAVRAAGFDACFTNWQVGCDMEGWANAIARLGLIHQSVHAPFGRVETLWDEGEEGEHFTDVMIDCLRDCDKFDVPIMVVHPIKGMDRHAPNDLGIRRFARLVEAAEQTRVKLAFENVEGLEYLVKVMDELGHSPAVGFCWDTGHEMCYNFSEDVTARFGDRLIATHFNDNLGMADPNTVTWLDDAHLLPFDGIADWAGIMRRIRAHQYTGILTFELTRKNKPGKHTHDGYAAWSLEEYCHHAYERACRVAALTD